MEGETASHASELSILGDGDESVSHCGYCDGKSSGASGRSISYGELQRRSPPMCDAQAHCRLPEVGGFFGFRGLGLPIGRGGVQRRAETICAQRCSREPLTKYMMGMCFPHPIRLASQTCWTTAGAAPASGCTAPTTSAPAAPRSPSGSAPPPLRRHASSGASRAAWRPTSAASCSTRPRTGPRTTRTRRPVRWTVTNLARSGQAQPLGCPRTPPAGTAARRSPPQRPRRRPPPRCWSKRSGPWSPPGRSRLHTIRP